ncbi:MAG TPA: hypothetical protein VHA13_03960 [Gammaproteobacteria bacterium]|nr:hypothetical protein [Gammaproteobacteria bacterium]
MAYLQREGGERFVIPSYRDVISKRKNLLKNDILQLSSQYGEYMALQRRGLAQFEVAFSHDAGYLFGECVWHYFKKPQDLIYCEAVPDTTEAYLVIVKNGVVYLDGVFPVETIPEELVIFTTQKNNFEIYIYGDVPISPEPMEGKFSLDSASIKLFNELDGPLFDNLPAVKAYQLQLIDVMLRQHGIGVFPVKEVMAVAVILGVAWMGYSYVNMQKKKMPVIVEVPPPQNPYLDFNKTLLSIAPDIEARAALFRLMPVLGIPGWSVTQAQYSDGKLNVKVQSSGAPTEMLYQWAEKNNATVNVSNNGYALTLAVDDLPKRQLPTRIYPLDRVISSLVDRLLIILPGNNMRIGSYKNRSSYNEADILISFTEVSPETVIIVSEQLKELPLVLKSLSTTVTPHGLTGTINLQALGS